MSRCGISTNVLPRTLRFPKQTEARIRRMQLAALDPPPANPIFRRIETHGRKRRTSRTGGLAVRPSDRPGPSNNSLVELDRRVQVLEKVSTAEGTSLEPAFYSEADLAAFYQDVLANSVEEQQPERPADPESLRLVKIEEDQTIVEDLDQRFLVEAGVSEEACGLQEDTYRRVLSRVYAVVARVEAVRTQAAEAEAGPSNRQPSFLPMGLLTTRECEALIGVSLEARDGEGAELAMELMKRMGLPPPEAAVDDALELYSAAGDATGADRLLNRYLTTAPTETQRHLHIQAHLKATPLEELPTSALDTLHSYEARALAAPMQTYTSVITSLFSRPSSIARAQAWDLFSHMRYVAHPNPDALLYTLMIRACASPISSTLSSEPEKALDFWTEMTVDHRIKPTVGAYNAIILACARSGTKMYVNEAFRLARQMLDSHRDAEGRSAYRPDRKTFCALLEGAKRIGDLGRARWILAEMVRRRRVKDVNAPVDVEVDEEVMMHVFQTYAAYRPPFQRAKTRLIQEDSNEGMTEGAQSAGAMEKVEEAKPSTKAFREIVTEGEAPSFAHIPPQSHAEVLQEVKFLFQRVCEERGAANIPDADRLRFKNVRLTPRLVNSYLAVFYKHASLDTSRDLFWKIYEDLGLHRSTRAYVEALERCGNAHRGDERIVALEFAEELWESWKVIEASGKHDGRPLSARMIERAHVAMIRVLILNRKVDLAMDQIRAFAARYEPKALRTPYPKLDLRSTRTLLDAPRPLVRMTSTTEVPDDHVPPFLTFADVEIVHHRLVALGMYKEIGYLKWLCKAYEWALRVRKDQATRAPFVKSERSPAVARIGVSPDVVLPSANL